MRGKRAFLPVVFVLLLSLALFSCSKEESGEETKKDDTAEETGEETISYISDEVSFSLYFDEEGTKRTMKLEKGQTEFDGYIILLCPEYISVAAVEFRIVLPEGVEIVSDQPRSDRVMMLGKVDHGISERFSPCVQGPKVQLHRLTFRASAGLENAEFSILPSEHGPFLGIAKCEEGYPQVNASAYKAVVNPAE